MALDNDEIQVLSLLKSIPRTRAEISEVTELDDTRLGTILQKLKRNDLIQLTEGKLWKITEIGVQKREEKVEEPEPTQKENLTKQFKIHKKRGALLNRCEELATLGWDWDGSLLKDLELIEDNIGFIEQKLKDADSMEELEELEALLEDVDKSWERLFIRNEQLSEERLKKEKDRKMRRIREFYLEEYPDISDDYLEDLIEMCEESSERLKEIYQQVERHDHLKYLLDNAVEHGIDTRFIRDAYYMAAPEKLKLEYLVQLWEDYNNISSRYGSTKAYYFIKDRGSSILKRKGDLWQAFHRYMFPQRGPSSVY